MICSHFKLFLSLSLVITFSVFTSNAEAKTEVRDLDVTISGADYPFDLNEDGIDDFIITDNGQGDAFITPAGNSGASILLDEQTLQPILFSPGETVRASSGIGSTGTIILYGGESIISQNTAAGAPFNENGSTGFIGLSVTDPEESHPFLGWAEITRGSVIIGSVGYQTTPNAGALVGVPEPTAALLAMFGMLSITGICKRNG